MNSGGGWTDLARVEELALHVWVPVSDRGDGARLLHLQVLQLDPPWQPPSLAAAIPCTRTHQRVVQCDPALFDMLAVLNRQDGAVQGRQALLNNAAFHWGGGGGVTGGRGVGSKGRPAVDVQGCGCAACLGKTEKLLRDSLMCLKQRMYEPATNRRHLSTRSSI